MTEAPTSSGPGRAHIIAALGLTALGCALFFAGPPLWWFGTGLIAALVVWAWPGTNRLLRRCKDTLSRPRTVGRGRMSVTLTPYEWLAEFVCLGVLVALSLVLLSEAAGGERPVSGDHPVHYVKVLDTRAFLTGDGVPWGWSHDLYAGTPRNYLYGFGADLWVLAVEALSFGSLDTSQAYGVGFWLFYLFMGWTVYRFGATFLGRATGLLAAVLFMTTLGTEHGGGWDYLVTWGVWPQWLALAFSLLAMCHLRGVLVGESWRPVALFGLWIGAAILTHPTTFIQCAILFVAAFAAMVWTRSPRLRQGLVRLGLGGFLGAIVAAAWLLPFWSTGGVTDERGFYWHSAHDLGRRVWELDLFPGELPLIFAAGVVGLVVLLRRRDSLTGAFIAFFTFLAVVVSTSSWMDELHLVEMNDAFRKVIWQRIAALGKPFLFIAAAHALLAVLSGRWRRPLAAPQPAPPVVTAEVVAAGAPGRLRSAAWTFVLVTLLAPFGFGAAQSYWSERIDPDTRAIFTRDLAEDRRALIAWGNENLPRDGFYRLMIRSDMADRRWADLGVELGIPIYKPGFTPVSNYLYKVGTESPATLRALNVRYVLTTFRRYDPAYEEVKSFGSLWLYRYRDYQREPFEVLDGEGDVTVESFERDALVLAAGPGSNGRLRLNLSDFPRWSATRDGAPVAISLTSLENNPLTGFMTVALAPGRYHFVFSPNALDYAGLALTPLGLLLVVLLALSGRSALLRSHLADRLDRLVGLVERVPALSPRLHRALVAAALAGFLVIAWAMSAAVPATTLPRTPAGDQAAADVGYDFLESLGDASVSVIDEASGEERQCNWVIDRHLCGADTHAAVVAWPTRFHGTDMARCIRADPKAGRTLVFRYAGVPRRTTFAGIYGMAFLGRAAKTPEVHLGVWVDGQPLLERDASLRPHRQHFQVPFPVVAGSDAATASVEFRVASDGDKPSTFCFSGQLVNVHRERRE